MAGETKSIVKGFEVFSGSCFRKLFQEILLSKLDDDSSKFHQKPNLATAAHLRGATIDRRCLHSTVRQTSLSTCRTFSCPHQDQFE